MNWLNILGIAVGLAMDAFAVSLAAGLVISPLTGRHVFRLAFHFGLFQFMMPILGYLAGRQIAPYIAAYDHWFAFGLLSVVGGHMLMEARSVKPFHSSGDPSRGLMLVTLSVATSIDALAVGLSIAFLQGEILIPAIVIGLVAGLLSLAGVLFGNRLGAACGQWAAAIGGCVLIGIGLKILLDHLTA